MMRYSDVYPYEERRYWYFTLHGTGPGTIPKDLHILEEKDGVSKHGTKGLFVCLDGALNTDELRKYDLTELRPDWDFQKNLSFEEFMKLAREQYNKGGDTFYECWDKKRFDLYIEEFGYLSKGQALDMFQREYEHQKEAEKLR